MNKNNTKAIRIDDDDLLSIEQYKFKYEVKTDSDAIRELIKDGLSFNNINNKSITYYLKLIRDDNNSELNNNIHRDLAHDLLLAINHLKDVNLFIEKYFYDENENKLSFDYDSFLSKCLVNADDFIGDLSKVLLDQYFNPLQDVCSSYIMKAIKVFELIQFAKFKCGILDLNNINNLDEVKGLLADCYYILLEERKSNDRNYLYSRHEYMNLHCDIINNVTYVAKQNVNDYQFYQKTKELFLLLNESYLGLSVLNDL